MAMVAINVAFVGKGHWRKDQEFRFAHAESEKPVERATELLVFILVV